MFGGHAAFDAVLKIVAGQVSADAALLDVAVRAAAVVRVADGAAVAVVCEPGPALTAATSPWARSAFEIHTAVRQGPAASAFVERRAVLAQWNELTRDWPAFAARARALRVHSVLAMPLICGDDLLGVLALYTRSGEAFTEDDAAHVQAEASDVACVALAARTAHQLELAQGRVAELTAALRVRPQIDEAIGIIRARTGQTSDAVMAELRAASVTRRVKVAEIAREVIDDALRQAPARRADT